MGSAAIVQKLQELPFRTCMHIVEKVDCQPTPSGVLVFVSGQLAADGETAHPMHYAQVFHLLAVRTWLGASFSFFFRFSGSESSERDWGEKSG